MADSPESPSGRTSGFASRARRIAAWGGAVLALGFVAWWPLRDTAADGVPSGRVAITYWELWGNEEKAAMEAVVRDFNVDPARGRDRLYVRFVSASRLDAKLKLAMGGGVPPDVAGLSNTTFPAYAEAGALLPLDDLEGRDGFRWDAFLPAFGDLCVVGGRHYAVPSTPSVMLLHWNKALFREAGLDPDRAPRTLEELERANDRISRRRADGSWERIGHLPSEPDWWIVHWPLWFGGEAWDGRSRMTLDSPGCRRAWDWMRSYPARFGGADLARFKASLGPTLDTPQNGFFTGRVGMVLQGVWFHSFVRKYRPDMEVGVAPFPAPAGCPGLVLAETNVWVVPRGAPNPEGARTFIAYLASQPVMERLCKGQGKSTPLRAAGDDFLATHPHPALRTFIDAAASPDCRAPTRIPTRAELDNDLRTFAKGLLYGTIEGDAAAESALQSMQARQQRLLDRRLERLSRATAADAGSAASQPGAPAGEGNVP